MNPKELSKYDAPVIRIIVFKTDEKITTSGEFFVDEGYGDVIDWMNY